MQSSLELGVMADNAGKTGWNQVMTVLDIRCREWKLEVKHARKLISVCWLTVAATRCVIAICLSLLTRLNSLREYFVLSTCIERIPTYIGAHLHSVGIY